MQWDSTHVADTTAGLHDADSLDDVNIRLPYRSAAFCDTLQLIWEKTPDIGHLVEVVRKDAAAKQELLQRVNVSRGSVERKVKEVEKAVILLGSREVSNLVLGTAIRRAFPPPAARDARAVQTHILKMGAATAAFAQLLCDRLDLTVSASVFAAGMVLQLGRLVLLFSYPKEYTALWLEMAAGNTSMLAAPPPSLEIASFGVDTAELGAAIGEGWEIPADLLAVISCIDTPEAITRPDLQTLVLVTAAGLTGAVELYEPFAAPSGLPPAIVRLADRKSVDPQAVHDLFTAHGGAIREALEATFRG